MCFPVTISGGSNLLLSLALTGLIFGVIGLVIGICAFIEVKALKRSTHTIQYIDPPTGKDIDYDEEGFEILSKKTREKLEDESDLFDDETNFSEMQ